MTANAEGRLIRFARVALPGAIGGGGLALSLPPFGYWPLAFVGAAIVWWRLSGLRLWGRFGLGWSCGLVMFGVSWEWITAFNTYGGLVAMLVESLFFALACALSPTGRGRILVLPAAMVLAEAVRDRWPFGGVPLGGLDLGQVSGPLAGAARLGGPLLLTWLPWLCGASLGSLAWPSIAHAVDAMARRRAPSTDTGARPRQAGAVGLLATGVVGLAAVAAFGAMGAIAPDGGPAVGHVRVASVQGGGVRGFRKSQVNPAVVLAAQFAATTTIAAHDAGRSPTLIVWPEDVVSLDGPLDKSPVLGQLEHTAKAHRATLIAGITETVDTTSFRNVVCTFTPNGRLSACFEKVHRVPFGEYVPFRAFISHLANLSAVPLDAIPGTGSGLLRTPAGPVGVMISYEVFFADRGRSSVRAGAELLLVPTNTSSYSTGQVPTQEIAAARLQALSEGRDLVQCAPTGYSAIIDNQGHVEARSSLGARQVLVGTVALRRGSTLYELTGDLPWVVLAALLLLIGWMVEVTALDQSPAAVATRRIWADRRRRNVAL